MILYGSELVKKIRTDFDNAKNRIWIMVPFIGHWTAVKKIMGTKWINNSKLDMKIITDTRNDGFIDAVTIKQFLYKAEVNTLPGLHAKVYIIDNSIYITSANLTGTAFSKRYEICEHYNISDDNHDIITVFKDWWKRSRAVPLNWQPSKNITGPADGDFGNAAQLTKLWNLPEGKVTVRNFKDYQDNISFYNNLLKIYKSDRKRLLPKLTEYHELDAFLNFLFHEHKNIPSFKYLKEKDYRKLNDAQRIMEVKKYKSDFKVWLKDHSTYQNYREKGILIVQKKLSPKNIDKLDSDSLREVVGTLHSMKSLALNKARFLNPKNNDLKVIINSFTILLHDTKAIEERMEICNDNLRFFGKSSIKELVSWYYPNDFPTMNRNTSSGLKFLGYDIKIY